MKELYKPFKSTVKNKKFDVYVKGKGNKTKKISFGDSRYKDFTQHKDKKRRDNYLKRARGILKKDGTPAYLDKNSPAYWSYYYLWDG